jgi:hypothetical protein
VQIRIVLVVVALGVTGPAVAHHSAAMFDPTKTVVLDGVVKQFRWTNPHSWLIVAVQSADGTAREWSIEMTSPNLLSRAGWRPGTIKPGEKIRIVAAPLRDGSAGAQFKCAMLSDGRRVTYESVRAPASDAAAAPAATSPCDAGDKSGSGKSK